MLVKATLSRVLYAKSPDMSKELYSLLASVKVFALWCRGIYERDITRVSIGSETQIVVNVTIEWTA